VERSTKTVDPPLLKTDEFPRLLRTELWAETSKGKLPSPRHRAHSLVWVRVLVTI
jgi:hypothetical protein